MGDIVCLYTDGIIEAMNTEGEQYGYERLARYIRENADKVSRELTAGVRADVATFVGKAKQHDDQSFLIMKIL